MNFECRKNIPLSLDKDISLQPFAEELRSRREHIRRVAEKLQKGRRSLADAACLHEYFGMHRTDDGWIFREYAPNAAGIVLTGDFSSWQEKDDFRLYPKGDGVWEGVFPKNSVCHGMHFKMIVSLRDGSKVERIPAYARYLRQDEESKLFSAAVWETAEKYVFRYPSPKKSALLIYEAHPGMAQEEEKIGSYKEFAEKIMPMIAEKGYNTVELMGIMEHPYYASFGYHVSSFFAVSSRFGTPDEFKQMVDEAHRLGLRVIIDLVHSHAVKNTQEGIAEIDGCRGTYFHADSRGEHPAWDSLCFDYSRENVLLFLLSNCRFFLEEYHVDGFRFDGVTSMIYKDHGLGRVFSGYEDYFSGNVDVDALTYLALANRVIHEVDPQAVTIAEDVSGMPSLASAEGVGFDYRMAMGVTDMWFKMLDIPWEKWNMFYLFHELTSRRKDEKSISYAECHDQAIVGGQSAFFRMVGADIYENMHKGAVCRNVDMAIAMHKLMRLATAACAGHGYLNFMGNEFGHPEWIDMPREGNAWSMKHARRQWSLEKDETLRFGQLSAFDRAVMDILSQQGFWDAAVQLVRIDDDDKVIVFERGGYWFFFNFHPDRSYTDYEVEVLRGSYDTILDSDEDRFGGFARREKEQRYFTAEHSYAETITLYLPSCSAAVLKRNFP